MSSVRDLPSLDSVRRLVERAGVTPRDAEDVAQDARQRVWERLDRIDPAGNAAAWMKTVVVNLARDHLRPDRGGGALPSARAAPRRRRRRRADRSVYPSIDVPMTHIVAEQRLIVSVLSLCGVPDNDLADVLQEVYLGAYRSVRAGRYRPPAHLSPRGALTRWLTGIAWRQALKYGESAQRRLVPAGLRLDLEAPRPMDQILAREALGAVRALRPHHQQVVIYLAEGMTRGDIAARMSIPGPTASTWIRGARLALEAAIARGERVRRRPAPAAALRGGRSGPARADGAASGGAGP